MKIHLLQNDNISMQKKHPTQRILDVIPEYTKKESAQKLERWKKIDEIISKPAENRGIMGATAILTQPAIDYYNNKVDEETRLVSRNRTIAKIIAGTLVGMFVVRGPIYKLITKMTDIKGKSKYSKYLLPQKYINEISQNEKFLKNYRSALSMSLALGAMCFTNFLLDAPFAMFITNKLNKMSHVEEKRKHVKSKGGGENE